MQVLVSLVLLPYSFHLFFSFFLVVVVVVVVQNSSSYLLPPRWPSAGGLSVVCEIRTSDESITTSLV